MWRPVLRSADAGPGVLPAGRSWRGLGLSRAGGSAAAGPTDGEDDRPARSWLRLIFDPLFGRYFFGRILSSAGIWIHNIVAALLAYELTGSAFVVGLVSVAQFLPQTVLAPLSGAIADRGNRKRQVIIGRFIVAGGSGGLALWLQLTHVSEKTDATVLVLSAFVVGIGFVTGGPAMHAMVPALVRRSEIASAVTLNMAPVTLSRAIGPAVGAAIALSFGPPAAFAIAAACNVGFALVLIDMRMPPRKPQTGGDRSVRAGFAFLRQDPVSGILLVGVTAVGIGADPAITLAPPLSAELGYGTAYAGAFASSFGIGAGVAFLVLPGMRRWPGLVRTGTLGLFLMAVGWLELVFVTTPWVAMPGFGISGLGMTLAVTSLSAQLQQRLPDEFRGRIMALWSVAFLGSRPLAAALNGGIADLVSVAAALWLVAAVLLAAAWLCSPRRLGP